MTVKVIINQQNLCVESASFDKLIFELNDLNRTLYSTKMQFDALTKRTYFKHDKDFFFIDYKKEKIVYSKNIEDEMISYLNNKNMKVDIVRKGLKYKPKKIDIKMVKGFTPIDYQKPFIKEIKKRKSGTILVNLDTGYGKTVTVLNAMCDIGESFMMVLLPKYIPKWIEDLTGKTDIKREEIMVIQGGGQLRDLFLMDEEELSKYKVFLLSLKTFQNYLKEYKSLSETFTYSVEPYDITEFLKIGYVLNDESHQEFFNVFMSHLFLESKLFIGITATLVNRDKKIVRMYDLMFPKQEQVVYDLLVKRYIDVVGVKYYFKNMKGIRFESQFGYSHTNLENSILKNTRALKSYIEMIGKVGLKFVKKRAKEDKMMIFFNKVDLCKLMVRYLKSLDAYKDIKITKYTEEDSYKVIEENDLIITTLLSER